MIIWGLCQAGFPARAVLGGASNCIDSSCKSHSHSVTVWSRRSCHTALFLPCLPPAAPPVADAERCSLLAGTFERRPLGGDIGGGGGAKKTAPHCGAACCRVAEHSRGEWKGNVAASMSLHHCQWAVRGRAGEWQGSGECGGQGPGTANEQGRPADRRAAASKQQAEQQQ